jgi:hypothetical protein
MSTQEPDWQQTTGSPGDLLSQRTRDERRRYRPIGDFFLMTGALISLLGCVFAVAKTLYGLWTLQQIGGLIAVPTGETTLLVGMILLDGLVWFCLSAALLVVFLRVSHLTK